MALNIGDLVGRLRADDSGWRRGLDRARLRMAGLQRDTNGRLRDMNGRFVTAGALAGRGWARRMLRTLGTGMRSGIGTAFTTGLSGLRGVLGSISSNPIVALVGAALAMAIVYTMLPLITALLSGAVIAVGGLSVIGLGAALLKDEPKVKKAAGSLIKTVKGIFNSAAKPLIKPFTEALKSLEGTAKDVAPLIKQMFSDSAGFVKPLTSGINTLVKEALPGFVSMIGKGQPVFDALGKMLGSIGKGLGRFFAYIGTAGPQAGTALQDVGRVIGRLIAETGRFIAFFARLYDNVRPALVKVVGVFRWLYNVLIGHSIIPDLINGIVRWFSSLPGRILGRLAGFVSGVISRLGNMKDRAVARARDMVNGAVTWLSRLPGRASGALSSLASRVAGRANEAGSRLVAAIRSKVSSAVSTVRTLPGRARSALGNLAGVLFRAGQSIIQGFINGIRNKAGAVANAVSGVLSAARNLLPFSPAKEGPFSGRGWTLFSGQSLMTGLAEGIGKRQGLVSDAMARAAQAASTAIPGPMLGPSAVGATAAGSLGAAGAGRGSGGEVLVRILLEGDDEHLKKRVRNIVRVDGRGDVQVAFGKGGRGVS